MKLQAKVTLSLSLLVAATLLILVGISAYSFRAFSIASATEHLRTTAEVVRVSLTESMINGVIDKRESFLSRLMEVKGLKSARVARGPQVEQQFGKGLNREAAADEIERRVLREGVPQYVLLTENGESVFRGTIPFVANSTGSPNCLNCHKVAEGAVLGVVTMTMSIEHMKTTAMATIAGMIGAMSLLAVLLVLLMRRMVRPISETAAGVENAVRRALAGDFTAKVEEKTHDEIGQIAADTNKLLAFLNSGLNRIGEQVTQLTNRKPLPDENLLKATIHMVEGLARAARFKQAIEEDESKSEIYSRLSKTLIEEFNIRESSLYEVAPNRKQMTATLIDGEAGADCRWCDPEILVRPEACRVRRTGHVVDSTVSSGICTAFRPPADCSDREHICFPIIQSGSVGSVLQLVVAPDRREAVQEQIPYIGVYLRETSPVLEAKRLMDSLRESTLRDPMTGLNNRRFLEEFVATLIANVQRRKTVVSILMLDLDFFKMVNDTHGHDAGDMVLKALAKTLQQAVRAADLVIRYGGEEFLILLVDVKDGAGDKVAETIRSRVEALKIPVGTATLQKTISIGIADFPTDSDTFWQAVKFADVALYKAKETGRNKVVRFTPDMWSSTAHY